MGQLFPHKECGVAGRKFASLLTALLNIIVCEHAILCFREH